MYVFILIILIAELIIALAIVFGILKFDRKVIELSNEIDNLSPKIKQALKTTREQAQKVLVKVKTVCEIIINKQEKYVINLLKNILFFIVILFSKGKNKKFLSGIELALSIRDFLACK